MSRLLLFPPPHVKNGLGTRLPNYLSNQVRLGSHATGLTIDVQDRTKGRAQQEENPALSELWPPVHNCIFECVHGTFPFTVCAILFPNLCNNWVWSYFNDCMCNNTEGLAWWLVQNFPQTKHTSEPTYLSDPCSSLTIIYHFSGCPPLPRETVLGEMGCRKGEKKRGQRSWEFGLVKQ